METTGIIAVYMAKYADQHGTEKTTILNDGRRLRMTLRGVEFCGKSFNEFEPVEGTPESRLVAFQLDKWGQLTSYALEVEMPMSVGTLEGERCGFLVLNLTVGDRDDWQLTLRYDAYEVTSDLPASGFSDAAISLHKKLPAGVYLKACIDCRWSDYSPYGGKDCFDDLLCHRKCKQEFLAATTKEDHGRLSKQVEWVQATFLCDEFEPRTPESAKYWGWNVSEGKK